jgi:hypothetical protein
VNASWGGRALGREFEIIVLVVSRCRSAASLLLTPDGLQVAGGAELACLLDTCLLTSVAARESALELLAAG